MTTKALLQKPIKAIIVGDVPVICKQMGKYFDEFVHVGREQKVHRKELDGAQILVFAMQACNAGLRQDWTDFAKGRNIPIFSCRNGSEIPQHLAAYFTIVDPAATTKQPQAVPASQIKAQKAQEEAQQIVERTVAEPPSSAGSGIQSLDLIAGIQKEVQGKLTKAQQDTDEATSLYLKESEKVTELNALLSEAQTANRNAEEKIELEIKARLAKAVEKETIKLRTELHRKDKAVQDAEKKAEKAEETANKAVQAIAELHTTVGNEVKKQADAKKNDVDISVMVVDISVMVMTNHMLTLAHAIQYLSRDNKWIAPMWKLLKCMSTDDEVITVVNRIKTVSLAKNNLDEVIMIPPMEDAKRDAITAAIRVRSK
jgi:hypothetical protein